MGARAELETEDKALADKEKSALVDLSRAQRARVILEDPLVAEAFALMESKVLDAWRASDGSDHAGRERLYHYQRAIRQFRTFFAEAVTTGKFAEREIAQIRKRRSFLSFRLRNRAA